MTAPDGTAYNCCEQYMMYQKALLFGDSATAQQILAEPSPAQQKDLGRGVQHFDKARWDQHKVGIVWYGNYLKFTQHADLQARLLATGSKHIAEASPVDLVWGVSFEAGDDRILDTANWTGENLLCKVLISVRCLLRAQAAAAVARAARL